MLISGFRKMTLLDYPNKVACTVFTGGCNFRCPFCHNASLVTDIDKNSALKADEILSFLKKRTGLLDGVCITGGEPLMHPDVTDFIKEIKSLGFSVKVDTNGSFPDRLKEIVNGGLADYVAMDVKNSPEKYAMTVGVENFDITPVKESVKFLKESGAAFEFRTTVVKEFHDVADIEAVAEWIGGAPAYYLQNFEDSGNLICGGLHSVDNKTMERMRISALKHVKNVSLRGI
ncbi:MAG: anaerobic ribonucleoside-triphosphate reductase activating protein [Clostridia bacterium]|nr:anaerobic ribonucleoside-triphosphate reductase activating protein [Clostridia bacterium]